MNTPEPPSRPTLEQQLMTYADAISTSAAPREQRSWARLRRALRAPESRTSRPWWRWRLPLVLAPVAAVAAIAFVLARPVEAVVVAGQGQATAFVNGQSLALRVGDRVPAGSVIRTAPDGWVALQIEGDRISIDTGSTVAIKELSRFPRQVVVEQQEGRTWNVLVKDEGRSYTVRTASGDIVARGTAFLVTTLANAPSEVAMAEGTVQVAAPAGSATVAAGQRARLSAAPPVVDALPTQQLTTDTTATLVDALGRSCGIGGNHLPGCLATAGKAFTVLAGIAKDVSVEVRLPAAGTVGIATAQLKQEVTVPGEGTFRIKLRFLASDSALTIDIKDTAKRVKEAKPGTEAARQENAKAAEEAKEAADKATAKATEAATKAAAKTAEAAQKAQVAATSGSDADRRAARQAAEAASEAAEKAKEAADDAAEDAKDAAEEAREAADKATEKGKEAAEKAAEKAKKEAEKAKEAAEKAAEKAKEAAEKTAEKFKDAAKDAAKEAKEVCEAATEKAKEDAKRAAELEREQAKAAAEKAEATAKQAEDTAKAACEKVADKDACKKNAEALRGAAEQAAEKAKQDAELAAEAKKEAAERVAKQAKEECAKAAEKAKEAQQSPKPSPPPGRSPEPSTTPERTETPRPSPTSSP